MNLKAHEIVLAILAVVVPLGILVMAFIPGGLSWIIALALDPTWGPVVFFGGAALVIGGMLLVAVPELSVAQYLPDFDTLQSLIMG